MATPYAGANAFPASYLIPDDGDVRSAASVNVALEALGDRTVYLYDRINPAGYVLFNAGLQGGNAVLVNWTAGSFSPAENLGLLSFGSGLKANDIIEAEFWSSFEFASSPLTGSARIAVSENSTSYTDVAATWTDAVGGSSETMIADNTAASVLHNVTLHAEYTVVAATPASVRVVVQGKSTGMLIAGSSKYGFKARIYRPVP